MPTVKLTVPAAAPFRDSRVMPAAVVPETRARRNILMFIADDYGNDMLPAWRVDSFLPGDFTAHPLTPVLDSLLTTGVRFRNHTVQPSCTPTRAAMETGRYAFRTGMAAVTGSNNVGGIVELGIGPSAVDPLEVTLPRLCAARGYDTTRIGKYHMAQPSDAMDPGFVHEAIHGMGWDHPTFMGYRRFRGNFWNVDRNPYPATVGEWKPGHYNFFWYDSETGQQTNVVGIYSTTHIIDAAIDSILNDLVEPWLCVVAFPAPHSPWGPATGQPTFSGCMPPTSLLHSDPSVYDADLANPSRSAWDSFRAAIEAEDKEKGRLFTAMGSELMGRTDIIYTGDNGTPAAIWSAATALGVPNLGSILPTLLAGSRFKSSVYAAGVRVPFIISSPIVRGAPRATRMQTEAVDVFETIRHLTASDRNNSLPPSRALDGTSLVQLLQSPAANAFHPKRHQLSERWTPNGPASAAASRERSFTYRADDGGMYRLIRITGQADEFYRIRSTANADVDPWELNPLPYQPGDTYRAQYVETAAALVALLQS